MNDDSELNREASIVLGGFLLMMGVFLVFIGCHPAFRSDAERASGELVNKGNVVGLVFIYFTLWGFFTKQKDELATETRWQWFKLHWRAILGLVVFEFVTLGAWVHFMHSHSARVLH